MTVLPRNFSYNPSIIIRPGREGLKALGLGAIFTVLFANNTSDFQQDEIARTLARTETPYRMVISSTPTPPSPLQGVNFNKNFGTTVQPDWAAMARAGTVQPASTASPKAGTWAAADAMQSEIERLLGLSRNSEQTETHMGRIRQQMVAKGSKISFVKDEYKDPDGTIKVEHMEKFYYGEGLPSKNGGLIHLDYGIDYYDTAAQSLGLRWNDLQKLDKNAETALVQASTVRKISQLETDQSRNSRQALRLAMRAIETLTGPVEAKDVNLSKRYADEARKYLGTLGVKLDADDNWVNESDWKGFQSWSADVSNKKPSFLVPVEIKTIASTLKLHATAYREEVAIIATRESLRIK